MSSNGTPAGREFEFTLPIGYVDAEGEIHRQVVLRKMTGREEGGPASVLESLAAGTPLVAHRTGMAPDVVVHGTNGFLVDVGDSEAMIDAVDRILRDTSLRERIGRAGIETAGRYAWPAIAAQYEQLYRSVKP